MMQKTPNYITILVLGAVLLTLGYWMGSSRTPAERTDLTGQLSGAVREVTDPDGAARQARLDKDAENAEAQKRALAHQQKLDAVDLADRARDLYDQALAEEKRWQDEVRMLLTNDDGRYLAADDRRAKLFEATYTENRPSRDTLVAAKSRLEELAKPVRATLDDRGAAPPLPSLVERIRAEKTQAADALAAYQKPRETIEALLAEAKRDATPVEGLDLSTKLATMRQIAMVTEREAKQREEDARLAKEKGEREARERFLAQARDPALLAKFQPFLAKGRYTGGKISNSYFLKEHGLLFEYPRPMSYQAITAADFYNVLNDFNLFYHMGCGLDEFASNDRPKWPRARSDDDIREYRNRWQDFKYYAATWKELGILSP